MGETSGELSEQNWRGVIGTFCVSVVALLAICSGYLVMSDPYFVFGRENERVATRVLDVDMRRVKALQIVSRLPQTVIIGSSVVYRGIEPPPGGYNAGFSSAMGYELPVVAAIAARSPFVDTVVFGLDYFMFTDVRVPVRINADLARLDGFAKMLLSALMSTRALEASLQTDSVEPGVWFRSGFRSTPERSSAHTQADDRQQRQNVLPYRPTLIAHLGAALDALPKRNVVIYASPVSAAQWQHVVERGHEADFQRWIEDVSALARARGVPFHDLSRMPIPQDYDPCCGSSGHWFDNLHFKPSIGAAVLQRIGLSR